MLTYSRCPRENQHAVETRHYKKCDKAKKTGIYCADAVLEPSLGIFGSTRRGGLCPYCRDSGMSVDTMVYESVSTTTEFYWGASLTEPA